MSGLGRSLSLNTGSSLFGGSTSSQPPATGGLFGSTNTAQQPAASSGGLFGNAAASQTPKTGAGFSFGSTTTSQPAAAPSGGLFGNTAPASQPASTGLFGSTAAASKPGGLFGNAATSAPAAGGLFGGAAAASSAPPAGGLFGGSTAQSSAPAAGGLFGNTATSAPPKLGLFGGTNTAASSAPATGGLFGGNATSQPAAGGLFGSTAASSTPASGGLFGGAKPAAPSGGLFGGSIQTQQPAPSGGLLGGAPAQTQQPAPSSSLFGALNNANTSNLQTQQQTVPAVKIDWTNVKPTTRFNELHQEVQDAILFVEEIIQGGMKASMQCSETIPGLGRQIESLPADVEYLERRLETVEGALGRDAVAVGQNKQVIEKDSEDAVRLFRAIENLKLPNQFHYSSIGGAAGANLPSDSTSAEMATDLIGYFNTRAEELEREVKLFSKHQRDVDAHLRTVEYSTVEGLQKLGRPKGQEATNEGLREVAGVMKTFEEAILRVAERVGEAREGVVDATLSNGLR